MSKKILLSGLLFAFLALILCGGFFALGGQKRLSNIINNNSSESSSTSTSNNPNNVNVLERARQYKLLYTINTTNSLRTKCNWKDIAYEWNFPKDTQKEVYKVTYEDEKLDGSTDNTETIKYKDINEAVSAFFDKNDNANNALKYDYIVEIYAKEKNANEKMPLYSTVKGKKILTSNLGVWQENDQYTAGLYETTDGFKKYNFDASKSDFTVPLKDEETIKKTILLNQIKFLNHEFLCEDQNIEKATIESIELIYMNIDDYIVPVYKIVGNFRIEFRKIKWTALINPVDFTELDYNAYEDTQVESDFTPRAYITEILLSKGNYTVKGLVPNKLISNTNGTKTASDFEVEFITTEETGNYVYGERKKKLMQEIEDTLEVDDQGRFTFTFTGNNFWRVEKLMYEDKQGQPLDEPTHSSINEIDRYPYDNWFKVKICSKFDGKEYCGEQSNIFYLLALN